MSEYRRLTMRNNNLIDTNCKNCKQCKKVGRKYICDDMTACDEEIINRLAELEDMIDDGRLWFTPSNGLRPNPFECAKRWEELWYEVRVQYNDLKDKIENGTLIELPCKVGDTIWLIEDKFENNIVECKVDDYHYQKDMYYLYVIPSHLRYHTLAHSWDLGKTWFLTKSEAEARLEQIRKEK